MGKGRSNFCFKVNVVILLLLLCRRLPQLGVMADLYGKHPTGIFQYNTGKHPLREKDEERKKQSSKKERTDEN